MLFKWYNFKKTFQLLLQLFTKLPQHQVFQVVTIINIWCKILEGLHYKCQWEEHLPSNTARKVYCKLILSLNTLMIVRKEGSLGIASRLLPDCPFPTHKEGPTRQRPQDQIQTPTPIHPFLIWDLKGRLAWAIPVSQTWTNMDPSHPRKVPTDHPILHPFDPADAAGVTQSKFVP